MLATLSLATNQVYESQGMEGSQPGRKAQDKGYELAHPHNAPASKGNSYAGSKLKIMPTTRLRPGCIGTGTRMKKIKSMHERQIDNLLKLSPEQRYEYFVRYCADFEQVWGLAVDEDNWVIFKDADGDDIFPLWSHPDLAEACCFKEHKQMGAKPQAIGLESFIKNCIPDMVSDGVKFGIFYDKSREGLMLEGNVLKAALEEEVGSVWE